MSPSNTKGGEKNREGVRQRGDMLWYGKEGKGGGGRDGEKIRYRKRPYNLASAGTTTRKRKKKRNGKRGKEVAMPSSRCSAGKKGGKKSILGHFLFGGKKRKGNGEEKGIAALSAVEHGGGKGYVLKGKDSGVWP